jgi:hypothetical protein
MDILHEIIETADNIMSELEETDFYEQYLFCDPFKLRRELEIQMQRNWEQLDDIHLSDEQLMEVINKVTTEGINKTFGDMVMDGTLIMDSVDANGEILYKINPEIDIDDLQSE